MAARDLLAEVALWLSEQAGRKADAEQAFREAAAAGDPVALRELAVWLSGRPGREADAEQLYPGGGRRR